MGSEMCIRDSDWAMGAPERIPHSLVGRSHGDLHGRNILVGVRRGEMQYPAAFDYGDMSDTNVIAWDFAKLETELKVRILPTLLKDEPIKNVLIEKSGFQNQAAAGLSDSGNHRRADRLAAFFGFEKLMDEELAKIDDIHDLEQVSEFQSSQLPDKLNRTLSILLQIRKEAAYGLGYQLSLIHI